MKRNDALIMLSICFLIASCGEKIGVKTGDSGNGTKSKAFIGVVENIKEMESKPWDKREYANIKENQIPMLKKSTERTSANASLNATYEKVLVRDANEYLNSGCTNKGGHQQLNAIFAELSHFNSAPGYNEALKMKQLHDEAANFANSGIGMQSVSSHHVSYDRSYESSHKSKAKSYLEKSSLKCKQTCTKLKNLASDVAYSSRRRNYCEKVVACYLNSNDPSQRERNVAHSNIANVISPEPADLRNKIDNHYKELQSK